MKPKQPQNEAPKANFHQTPSRPSIRQCGRSRKGQKGVFDECDFEGGRFVEFEKIKFNTASPPQCRLDILLVPEVALPECACVTLR